jgi:S-layer homology domain
MTNSPNPNPNSNPNRRRRLTADELIAIGVALAGIGTVFFWGIGQKYQPMFQGAISNLNNDTSNRQVGALGNRNIFLNRERRTIADSARVETPPSAPSAPTTTVVPPIVKTVEIPVETPKTVVPQVVTPSKVSVVPAFTDVPKQFWAEDYITQLQKRGILDDFGDGKFDPSKEITRGEYAKMLDRAFVDKPATATTSKFADIPTDYPRKEAIDKSVQLGFMTGYSPTKFFPNQPIPRYQLQISLAKGLKLPVPAITNTVLSKFTDADRMPKFARDKMAAAIDAGLIIKDNNTNLLKPVANATRADAAALIYQSLVKEGKIQPQK